MNNQGSQAQLSLAQKQDEAVGSSVAIARTYVTFFVAKLFSSWVGQRLKKTKEFAHQKNIFFLSCKALKGGVYISEEKVRA